MTVKGEVKVDTCLFERSAEKRERERGHEGKRVDEVRVDDERCCCEIRIYLVPRL